MPNVKNQETLSKIKEDLDGVSAVWVVDYCGLTVKEIQELRSNIRETGATMKVYKNTLMHIALAESDLPTLDDMLEGPSAFVFAGNDVAAAAKAIMEPIDKAYGEKFAVSEVALNGTKAPDGNRDSETNLGDLITDAMLWKVLTDAEVTVPEENVVAITNGGVRASIGVGDVTKKDINTVLPFGNTLAVVYVKGSELLEALEASTYCTPESIGGFPQVAGMQFTVATYETYDKNDESYPNSTYYGPKTINRVTIGSINGRLPYMRNP